jgi:hypothetical protein
MCNQWQWDAVLAAMGKKEEIDVKEFSISYMLAGEGDAIGVSGPHLMILVPDPAMLEGLSTDPKDPVYVMWKDTPYAHIMVKVAEEE